MRYIYAVLVSAFLSCPAFAAFTEFYCNAATGSNTNAGSTEGSPVYTETAGTFVASTGVFTANDALDLSGVSVGMFMAGYTDAGTEATWVSRITAVDDGANTITVSTTAKSGTLGDLTGNCSVNVGGVWAGPTATTNFPFPLVTNALTNTSGDYPRVNFKSGTNYSVDAENAMNNPGPIKWQGYTTTVGDGGRAVIEGITTGASYHLFYATSNADYVILEDFEFFNNGATGITEAVRITGLYDIMRRVTVHDVRSIGLYIGANGPCMAVECEAYDCNQSNQALYAGIYVHSIGCKAIRCVSHNHPTSNGIGFYTASQAAECIDCISFENAGYGAWAAGGGTYLNCDFYANASDGLFIRGTSGQGTSYIENCNFIDNGGYGINGDGTNPISGYVVNCGFGAGTAANTSGTVTGLDDFDVIGTVTYADDVTPWTDPANGDFRINLAAAQGTGRGAFLQTDGSHAGTVSYPDIGAAQHEDAGGSGATVHMPNLNGNLQ